MQIGLHLCCLSAKNHGFLTSRQIKVDCIETNYNKYSLLSIPQISRDYAKYVELSVVRGNHIMTYSHNFGVKQITFNSSVNRSL